MSKSKFHCSNLIFSITLFITFSPLITSIQEGEMGTSVGKRKYGQTQIADLGENFERGSWGAYDPVLIAEALFAIAKVSKIFTLS